MDHEESPLETKSGEDNQLSAIDGTVSEEDNNTSTNDGSQAELNEEHKSHEETYEAKSVNNVTGSGNKLVIYQWRNGIVPYYVDRHSYDLVIYRRIRKALDAIESSSCLVFKPIPTLSTGHSFVHFTNPNKERECVHTLSAGRRGEPVVVLGYDCMQERDIIHSVMHLLGFRDEVTHPRRDSYIRIVWNNIQPKYRPLFTVDTKPSLTHKLAEYDTLSIMHFHDRAFSINGGPTILPLQSGRIINPSDKLSLLDKMKLRIAFGNECNRRKVRYLLETCKNYARHHKKSKDNAAEDLCAFDKFKVTTVKYIQSGNNKNERLTGIMGIQIGQIYDNGNDINNINGINSMSSISGVSIDGINGINNNEEPNIVGVQIGAINNIGNGTLNIIGFNDFIVDDQINGMDGINNYEESDIVGVQSDEIHNMGNEIPNVNGINDFIVDDQSVQFHSNDYDEYDVNNINEDYIEYDVNNINEDYSVKNNGDERTTTRSLSTTVIDMFDHDYERTTTTTRSLSTTVINMLDHDYYFSGY